MSTARPIAILAALVTAILSATTVAGGRVELDLRVDQRAPITAQQQWLQRLSQAGVPGIRIRSAQAGDQPKIEKRGTDQAPIYAVTGIINSDDMLILPGARFRSSQASQIAAWVRDLAENGPPDQRPAKTAFGLTVKDFARLQADMAPPLGLNTPGMSRVDVIRQVAAKMSTPLEADSRLAAPLSKDIVAEDLSLLSRGTALAYVLRSPGLCLVPRGTAGNVSLSIVEARPNMEIWPIGWEPQKPGKDVKPEMYQLRPVEVGGVTVTQVMEVVSKRLEMPILLDHNAVARHGLEPDKVIAKYPSKRTTYSIMLKNVLFQARLKMELRVDEADQPFLWVTSVKRL